MKNLILFDAGCEDFIREALGLEVKSEHDKCAFGYINEDGQIKELTSYTELFELKID